MAKRPVKPPEAYAPATTETPVDKLMGTAIMTPIPELKSFLISATEASIKGLAERFGALTIAGVEDKTGYELVRAALGECRTFRRNIEETRVELKAESLRVGREIDATAKRLQDQLAPIERRLADEKAAVDQIVAAEQKRKADAVYTERVARLQEFDCTLDEMAVRAMSTEGFESAVEQARHRFAESVRLAEENRKLREQLEAQRKEQERVDRERQAEQRRIDAEAREKARVERNEKIAEEARIATEDRLRREAEERAEQERADAAEAKRQAAMAPSREKLEAFALLVVGLEVPVIDPATNAAVKAAVEAAVDKIRKIAKGL